MVICPIARAVHCTGCMIVKFCPLKTSLGDYGKEKSIPKDTEDPNKEEKEDKDSGKQ